MEFNMYCDESCHLENDNSNVMTIGGIHFLKEKSKEINSRIVDIKKKHGVSPTSEIKWTKISNKKLEMYKEVINYFFDDDDLNFRCILIDKTKLDHHRFSQDHDTWYYKMYFSMLKVIINPKNKYNIYIDIKDTESANKINKLNEVLSHSNYDFDRRIIKKMQPIRSHEVQIMQIVDILIGAICYHNRDFPSDHTYNAAKKSIIELIKKRSGYSLTKSTLYGERKTNIFKWEGKSEYDK